MNPIIVTCMYNKLYDTALGGRNRESAYKESMLSLSKMAYDIVCYTSPEEVGGIRKFFLDNDIKNVEVKPLDLTSLYFHGAVCAIKNANPSIYKEEFFWTQRCPEVMWGKTFMIMDALNSATKRYTHAFWIDAGLSSSSMIRHSYFPHLEDNMHYYSEGLFTKSFIENIVPDDDKIFALIHAHPNNPPIPERYTKTSYSNGNAMIGGFYGGGVDNMVKFHAACVDYINAMLHNWELFSEESYYSGIYNDAPELFRAYIFDTFYHEDWPAIYVKSDVTFSSILEKFK